MLTTHVCVNTHFTRSFRRVNYGYGYGRYTSSNQTHSAYLKVAIRSRPHAVADGVHLGQTVLRLYTRIWCCCRRRFDCHHALVEVAELIDGTMFDARR